MSQDTYPFLSREWVDAARSIRSEYDDRVSPPEIPLKANAVVTDVPFDDGEVRGYVNNSAGGLVIEYGEIEDAELTVTTDYETAKALFVAKDPAKIMESFMLGKILVTGDMTRLLSLAPSPDPTQMSVGQEIAARLEAITAH